MSVGDRIARLEQEVSAHEEHCEIKTREIWEQFAKVKESIGELKLELAKHTTKVATIVSFATFALGLLAQWLMK